MHRFTCEHEVGPAHAVLWHAAVWAGLFACGAAFGGAVTADRPLGLTIPTQSVVTIVQCTLAVMAGIALANGVRQLWAEKGKAAPRPPATASYLHKGAELGLVADLAALGGEVIAAAAATQYVVGRICGASVSGAADNATLFLVLGLGCIALLEYATAGWSAATWRLAYVSGSGGAPSTTTSPAGPSSDTFLETLVLLVHGAVAAVAVVSIAHHLVSILEVGHASYLVVAFAEWTAFAIVLLVVVLIALLAAPTATLVCGRLAGCWRAVARVCNTRKP